MTEIGVRIMPYPAPQEHPADKEGSPTVSARFRYTTREGQFYWQNMHGNSIQKSALRWWLVGKFLHTMHTGSPRSRNGGTWTVTTRASTRPRHHPKTRDFFSNFTHFLQYLYDFPPGPCHTLEERFTRAVRPGIALESPLSMKGTKSLAFAIASLWTRRWHDTSHTPPRRGGWE
jgi:hypothetical protein